MYLEPKTNLELFSRHFEKMLLTKEYAMLEPKKKISSIRLSYTDHLRVFSLIIFSDILLKHKPEAVIRSIINFTRDRSLDSTKIEMLHMYFSRMMDTSDVYT